MSLHDPSRRSSARHTSRGARAGRAAVTVAALLAATAAFAGNGASSWPSAGFDAQNTRYTDDESKLGVRNVAGLAVRWKVATAGDVSATPAVDETTVYFPDFAGNLYAVDRATGAERWRASIAALTGIPGDVARATPALSGDLLIVGDQAGKAQSPNGWLLGIDKRTGALRWKTMIAGGFPIVTQAAVVHHKTAYVGVASYEEALVRFGVPLTFRGSMLAVDVATGQIRWQTFMTPPGYTGAAIWGSTAAIDPRRKQLYVTTGNNYSIPATATECLVGATSPTERAACLAPTNYFDSVVALDLDTGAVRWAHKALPDDAWNLSCGLSFVPGLDTEVPGCPATHGPDHDFGQGATLIQERCDGAPRDLVGAGQKSGVYWALDADTGAVVWKTQAGTGGVAGGLQWGSAQDGHRIYTANANSEFKPWTLASGSTVAFGGWTALDAATGAIVWQMPNPAHDRASGPVSGANGVIYACSMDDAGHMYAMSAATGAVLWDFASGANCIGGAAIVDGTVFWGTGYGAQKLTPGTNDAHALFAFGRAK